MPDIISPSINKQKYSNKSNYIQLILRALLTKAKSELGKYNQIMLGKSFS